MTTSPARRDTSAELSGHWDVVVVGGRVAGAAAAYALAPYARRVLLLERSRPGMFWPQQASWDRAGVQLWADLGLADVVFGCAAPRIRSHTFRTGRVAVDYLYPGEDPDFHQMTVAREALDPALGVAAARRGVVVGHRASLRAVHLDGGRVVGGVVDVDGGTCRIGCDLLVIATGRRSRLAEEVGARVYDHVPSPWTTLLRYYRDLDLPSTHARYSYQPGSMLVAMPCGRNRWVLSVGLHSDVLTSGPAAAALFTEILRRDPDVGPVLAGGVPDSALGGAGKLRMYRRPMAGPGWVLVGDAGFHVDPMTALGVRCALTSVRLLRDRVAEHGRIPTTPTVFDGITEERDALLSGEWRRTAAAIAGFGPSPDDEAQARSLADDPELAMAELCRRVKAPVPTASL